MYRQLAENYLLVEVASLFGLPAHHLSVQILHLLPRPGGFAQKSQAGRHAGVVAKTVHRNFDAQHFPAIVVDQVLQDHLERLAVEWIGIFF
jgi:hypothetical protein